MDGMDMQEYHHTKERGNVKFHEHHNEHSVNCIETIIWMMISEKSLKGIAA